MKKPLLSAGIILSLVVLGGCASVPKESVELSATVGRDVVVVHKANRALAEALFDRLEADVNRFVDRVYAPYLIGGLLTKELSDFQENKEGLMRAINDAAHQAHNTELQQTALGTMDVFVATARERIEDFRNEQLAPVRAQRARVLDGIERAYTQIEYANGIVMGYLASVVKVHDAQAQILDAIGLEGFDEKAATKLARASEQIEGLTVQGQKGGKSLDATKKTVSDLKAVLDGLGNPTPSPPSKQPKASAPTKEETPGGGAAKPKEE